ncbi:MAG: rhodanese-like domain-containing protein [Bacteroidetes bacterium]|nr:rhodanese-like domain-containing protein [Bacteroidota bacterium]
MKNYSIIFLSLFVFVFVGCTNSQVTETQEKTTTESAIQTIKTDLSTSEFEAKIKSEPTAPLIDVRTPEEYSQGHLQNAVNIDWNGNSFATQISTLDKSKPVYVYCLSGKRSGAAADKMRSDGFTEVYELAGGIKQWQADNLPVVK